MTDYEVRDPATGELISSYETASASELEDAIANAHATFLAWASTSAVDDRAKLIHRVADLHMERIDELAALINQEMGKSLDGAKGEVEFSADIYRYYADNAATFLADEVLDVEDGTATVRRAPMGALLGIMPWNYPCYQVARFAGPNLAAGNTVLLKHAPQCPASSAAIAQIFLHAGFPQGAYKNVYLANEQVADVIADPRVRGVSLTGSERAGAEVAATAGRHLKKVVLELGGSDPFVVLGNPDLDAVLEAAVDARLENHGQACNAAKRFVVVSELYDEFLRRFTERMLAHDAAPLSSQAAADRFASQLDRAVAGGATLEMNGKQDGAWFPPGVLTNVDPDNPVHREELFGPVGMVIRAEDEADAIRIANDTPYGLGSYVFTDDPAQADRVANALDTGMVLINTIDGEGVDMPFGGTKMSGFGRELGRSGIEEFLNKKLVRTA